jgi:hypothetical protein
MNERIEGLWWKARIGYNNQNCDPEVLEKFAELIIKECVGIVENLSPGYQDYRNQIEDAFRSDCMAEIKYRFGIEE